MKKLKVFIDTDIGDDIDDALAIAYALKKNYDIVGFSTVYREARKRTSNVVNLLNAINKNIPVFEGYSEPITPNSTIFGKINYFSDKEVENEPSDAIKFMKECANKYGNDLVIIAIGGQTNIAHAILKYPEEMAKINKIIIMGGRFDNDNEVEWNIAQDPEACKIVAKSKIDLVYIPWDATNCLSLGEDNFKKILDYKDDNKPLSLCLANIVRQWYSNSLYKYVPILFDVAAIIYLTNDELFTVEEEHLDIIDKGDVIGITIVSNDQSLKRIKLVKEVNKNEIINMFMNELY